MIATHPAPAFSFEFFPPKDPQVRAALFAEARHLTAFSPEFFSVTYGAGGATRTETEETVTSLQQETGVPCAAHITCVGQPKQELIELARRYNERGILRLVALRGDMPGMEKSFRPHPEGFAHTADLIEALRQIAEFDISVAAFPETHPEAISPEADVRFLKAKLEAGAERAVMQYCFDTDAILSFLERCATAGITAPVLPGIMPVRDFAKIRQFSARCGATVPDELARQFERVAGDPAAARALAVDIAAEQIRRLREEAGLQAFHFYCLNKSDLTSEIIRAIG